MNNPNPVPYRLAKTPAERGSWDFVATQPGSTTLTTILQSAVIGPVLSKETLHLVHLAQRMLSEGLPRFPRIEFCVVDIRNVVDLHIRAMTAPEAAGQRFIATSDWVWMAVSAVNLDRLLCRRTAEIAGSLAFPNGCNNLATLDGLDMSECKVLPLIRLVSKVHNRQGCTGDPHT